MRQIILYNQSVDPQYRVYIKTSNVAVVAKASASFKWIITVVTVEEQTVEMSFKVEVKPRICDAYIIIMFVFCTTKGGEN